MESKGRKRKYRLSGIEHQFLGLSPTFWSNVPLLNKGAINLDHKNGVDCIVVPSRKATNDKNINNSIGSTCIEHHNHSKVQLDKEDTNDYLLPITRCEIVGIVVNKEIRRDNFIIYTVDDGTGLIDCSYYNDETNKSFEASYHNIPGNNTENNVIRLGDTVRIFGKLKCLASERNATDASLKRKANCVSTCLENNVTYTREIYVNNIAPIRQDYNGINEDNANAESIHYLRSIKFMKKIQRKKTIVENEENVIFNAPEVLNSLGQESMTSLLLSHETTANNDNNNFDVQTNMYINFNCPCNVSYKPQLLYCHCIAKSEPLDPHFTFRDALLQTLLQQQTKDSNDNEIISPFHFYYKSCLQDKNLTNIAETAIMTMMKTNETNTTALAVNIRRIFLNTFHALREDGIISLLDQDRDEYCLICSECVLKPWIKQKLSKLGNDSANNRRGMDETRNFVESLRYRPSYLQQVPTGRFLALLQLIEN